MVKSTRETTVAPYEGDEVQAISKDMVSVEKGFLVAFSCLGGDCEAKSIDFASRFPPRHLEAARLRGLEASRLSDLQILLTKRFFLQKPYLLE